MLGEHGQAVADPGVAGPGAAPEDEKEDGDGEDENADPVVEAQAAEAVGEVDPQVLDPEAAEGVEGHVEGEEVAPAQPEPPPERR